jgi:stage II sporulation protein D
LKGLVRGSFRGITVLERGASPRIVRAEVDGTNGVTQVTGPQLRARLGLFDTWASFTYISGSRKQSSDEDGSGKAERPSSTVPASTTVPGATISPDNGGATPPAAADATGGQAAAPAP